MFRDSAVWFWSTLLRLVADWVRLNEKGEQWGLQHTLLDKVLEMSSRVGGMNLISMLSLALFLLIPTSLVGRV